MNYGDADTMDMTSMAQCIGMLTVSEATPILFLKTQESPEEPGTTARVITAVNFLRMGCNEVQIVIETEDHPWSSYEMHIARTETTVRAFIF